ncbi:TfoX/Sxy family protein [Herbiconiux sp. CPCC 205763]|uniref:TfoX/Sxy family protein n=1 Tax=Herbiconiux aconitum TaxID=2970913 RepID=A0ABT2GQ35_9MICO|nr:TfoX/Sxy family protein [Herbiconiux aconitum]MCS5717049.1 TfoX/Sxy family protein [Herbiconiux aconitum]
MAAPINSEEALERWDLLAAELGDPAIARSRMMGRPILTREGTMFACLNGDSVGFKLGAATPEHEGALLVPGAELFDPSGKGRPFKDWVSIPVAEADQWLPFAQCAVMHVMEAGPGSAPGS